MKDFSKGGGGGRGTFFVVWANGMLGGLGVVLQANFV